MVRRDQEEVLVDDAAPEHAVVRTEEERRLMFGEDAAV